MENIKPLLYTEGSLTAALSAALQEPVLVDVLREFARPCTPEEAACLNENQLWQRDVVLRSSRPLILARTRVGLSQVQGNLRDIAQLGNRPLGEWLFEQQDLSKTSFVVDETKRQRDTVYHSHGAPIWVQEIFIV